MNKQNKKGSAEPIHNDKSRAFPLYISKPEKKGWHLEKYHN